MLPIHVTNSPYLSPVPLHTTCIIQPILIRNSHLIYFSFSKKPCLRHRSATDDGEGSPFRHKPNSLILKQNSLYCSVHLQNNSSTESDQFIKLQVLQWATTNVINYRVLHTIYSVNPGIYSVNPGSMVASAPARCAYDAAVLVKANRQQNIPCPSLLEHDHLCITSTSLAFSSRFVAR